MANIHELVSIIGETQHYFKLQASRQVDTALTLRNWLFGFYIAEYELNGADRAEYGQKLFKEIAKRLEKKGFRQIRERHLYLCKDFYMAYQNILRTVSAKFYLNGLQQVVILRTATAKLISKADITIETPDIADVQILQTVPAKSQTDVNKLINQLSFSHFIELLKTDSDLKRSFYEMEAVKNGWSVRELQRAMNSMLYERTGLSANKQAVIDKQVNQERILPEDVFRNPYILEFLGLKEETEYSESQLEQAIIDHLQTFLLELGKGFCFEARQKRITFDNKHYRIDLVFYHRV